MGRAFSLDRSFPLVPAPLALAVLVLTAPVSPADTCVDYSRHPKLVETHGTASSVGACAVDGNHLFTVGEDTLVVYAITRSPLSIAEVGRTPVPGARFDVVIVDGFAYVATELASVAVVDVSNPTAPAAVASVELAGFVRALSHVGDRIFAVTQWPTVLSVLDVADPGSPVLRGSVDDGRPIGSPRYEDLAVVAGRAYLIDGTDELWIVDVRDVDQPVSETRFALPGDAEGIATDGGKLFVHLGYAGAQTPGLYALDLAEPTAPTVVGSVFTPGLRSELTIREDVVFASCGSAGVQIVDVSGPGDPAILGGIPTGAAPGSVAAAADVAFAPAAGSGIHLLELGDLSSPIPRHLVPTIGGATNAVRASVIDAPAGVAYVAAGWVSVLDVTDPFAATTVRNVSVGGLAVNVHLAGPFLYVSMAYDGIRILDVSDPRQPVVRGALDTPTFAQQTLVRGDVAYVCDLGALLVMDVSDPDFPVIVRSLETPGTAWGLSLSGSLAYLADGTAGIQVLDLSDPRDPQIVQNLALEGEAQGVELGDGVAFVDASLAGIHVLDLSLPTQVGRQTTFTIPGVPSGLALTDDVLYVSNVRGGLHVFDVRDPVQPRGLGGTYVHAPNGITVADGTVYLASGLDGLNVLPAQCSVTGVSVLLDFLEVEVGREGVRLTGALSDAAARPRLRLLAEARGRSREVSTRWTGGGFVAEDRGARGVVTYRLFVEGAGGAWALLAERTVDSTPRPVMTRLEVAPNPLNPRTTVRFLAPEGERVRLEVFDLRGRRRGRLFLGTATGLRQQLGWEPRGLASGVYVLRMEAAGRVTSRRVTLVQ